MVSNDKSLYESKPHHNILKALNEKMFLYDFEIKSQMKIKYWKRMNFSTALDLL